ncbi:oligo-1,6-glucosidase [Enterococcus sp. PF1-24]|uniref:alpha-glucosidase n=1 Tax=unclassified Enterococcus TaxID=2608891 RepID=UPI002475A4C9|nr:MULTISPECIES: alpha-glucosidase [unclassified Enterococcus]MDH6363783.1 oligo-1,6-glucosidase [Enterococcus sp. PFB1-1]MDH6400739.1 oligo-1,6-glucosidase [Enterococcus sp. PF1-24]
MEKKWWKEAVVYQIYPKSFQDSNNDGIGDLQGIIQRMDYLKHLGIDTIWISPVYKSPMDDGGYDISDYYAIDEMFGDNQDFEELLKKAESLDIKVLMDLVVNHTSDEHLWFQEALTNPNSKYRNFYVFREGIAGQPPNNWRSYFGDSAWTAVPDEENMFYLHAFTKKQPDLNWENEELREEIYTMINYWLDKGLAGYRIDAILNIKKRIVEGQLPADGEDGLAFIGQWILNQPGIEVMLQELNQRTFKLHDSMTVAEADVPSERLKEYIGDGGFFSMVFDFSYTDIDVPSTGEWFKFSHWNWQEMKKNIYNSQLVTQANGWGAVYLENHDQPRSINKYIPEEYISTTTKKMLATLFMLLRGTPFIYQGQEIGMTNIQMSDLADYDDIATHDQYHRGILAGLSPEEALQAMNRRSRDNSRTPIQWDTSLNGGFSTAEKTWLKVNPNYREINAESAIEEKDSVFNYYRQLIDLRKNSLYQQVIIYGDFQPFEEVAEDVIVYQRILDKQKILVAINPTSEIFEIEIPEEFEKYLLSNYEKAQFVFGKLVLKPYESIVLSNY